MGCRSNVDPGAVDWDIISHKYYTQYTNLKSEDSIIYCTWYMYSVYCTMAGLLKLFYFCSLFFYLDEDTVFLKQNTSMTLKKIHIFSVSPLIFALAILSIYRIPTLPTLTLPVYFTFIQLWQYSTFIHTVSFTVLFYNNHMILYVFIWILFIRFLYLDHIHRICIYST